MKTAYYRLAIPSIWILLLASWLCLITYNQVYGLPKKNDLSGYCCVDGEISSSNKDRCKRNRGTYYSSKQDAEKGCRATPAISKRNYRPLQGFCCVDGEVSSLTDESCRKKKGKFSHNRAEAERICTATKGFCCDQGNIIKTTKGQCDKNKGSFFLHSQKAERICNAVKGFCCIEGDITQTTKGQCDKKKGSFSPKKIEAEKVCSAIKGFCCIKGNIAQTTKGQCDKRKGTFYATRSDANRVCKVTTKPITSNRLSSKLTKRTLKSTPATMIRPTRLPDLTIARTWLNRKCVMQVDIKNNGGPISGKYFNSARMHVSAGQDNSIPKAKSYLKYADPERKLQNAGGSITFNTGLKVIGSAQSLVWVDTAHHIEESNERNNGDDQKLFCKMATKKSDLKPIAKKQKLQPQLTPMKLGRKDPVQSPSVSPVPRQLNNPCLIDLAITNISIDPPQPKITLDHFVVEVTVRNIGTCNQTSDSSTAWFELYLTDYPYTLFTRTLIQAYTVTIPHLDAGEEHIFHETTYIPTNYGYGNGQVVTPQPGTYEITAIINTTTFEPNEEVSTANNTLKKQFEVRDPAPSDLALQSISLTSDCRLRVNIQNLGADIPLLDFNDSGTVIRASKDGWYTEQVALKDADPNSHVVQSGGSFVYGWPASQNSNSSHTMGLGLGQTATFRVAIDPYHHLSDAIPYNNANPGQGNNYIEEILTCY